jgi:hypothetical protein
MSKEVVVNVMAALKAAKPVELVELDFVKEKFITLHNQFNGNERGEQEYHMQAFNYKKMLSENATLRECSPLSLYGVFLDINVSGLSLEQGNKPDCYITTRNFKIGKDDQGKDVYEKRAQLAISPYGEVKMRMRAGQIKHADNPIVVYDCDNFKIGLNDKGKLVVKEYDAKIPRPDEAKIVACFVRVERHDGSFEMPYLDMKEVERLRGYSNKNNFGSATNDKSNALYTSNGGQIDSGFLKAKTLKHAFKSYPKVPTGKFTSLEPALEEELMPTGIDYGFDPDDDSEANTQDVDHEEVKTDEFSQALIEHSQKEPVQTKQFAGMDDDEPEF